MKMRFLFAFVGLGIGFATPAFAQQTNPPDSSGRQRLVALFNRLDQAFMNNDAAAVAANFTQDAVLVTPYGPISGRESIEPGWREKFFETLRFSRGSEGEVNLKRKRKSDLHFWAYRAAADPCTPIA